MAATVAASSLTLRRFGSGWLTAADTGTGTGSASRRENRGRRGHVEKRQRRSAISLNAGAATSPPYRAPWGSSSPTKNHHARSVERHETQERTEILIIRIGPPSPGPASGRAGLARRGPPLGIRLDAGPAFLHDEDAASPPPWPPWAGTPPDRWPGVRFSEPSGHRRP